MWDQLQKVFIITKIVWYIIITHFNLQQLLQWLAIVLGPKKTIKPEDLFSSLSDVGLWHELLAIAAPSTKLAGMF